MRTYNSVAVEDLLCDDAGQTAQHVPSAINDDRLLWWGQQWCRAEDLQLHGCAAKGATHPHG